MGEGEAEEMNLQEMGCINVAAVLLCSCYEKRHCSNAQALKLMMWWLSGSKQLKTEIGPGKIISLISI